MQEPDELWKKIIEDLFEDFLSFFMADLSADVDSSKGYEFLDKEFEALFKDSEETKRLPDKLVKVYLKDGTEQWILVHIEVQGYKDEDFSQRMFTYFYRIFDKYHKNIVALAIFTDEIKGFKPAEYRYNFYKASLSYEYRTYKVLTQGQEELEKMDNPFAIAVLAGLLVLKSHKKIEKKYEFKIKLIRLLLAKKYERTKIVYLLTFLDGLLALPKDLEKKAAQELKNEIGGIPHMGLSPKDGSLTKMIYEYGEKEGEKKGRKEGEKKGEKKGLLRGIELYITVKFGSEGVDLLDKIRKTEETEKLERVMELIIRTESLEEVKKILMQK
jgi:hypothetical protein